METFTSIKDIITNPGYKEQRRKSIKNLPLNAIDPPIVNLISKINKLSCCFTLQCCYGHFLHKQQQNTHCCESLPILRVKSSIEYRIAYIAFCLEESILGKQLFKNLMDIPSIDPDYIQVGCAGWFWQRQINSYALQVEPKRFMEKDSCKLDYEEVVHVQKVRDAFFLKIDQVINDHVRNS